MPVAWEIGAEVYQVQSMSGLKVKATGDKLTKPSHLTKTKQKNQRARGIAQCEHICLEEQHKQPKKHGRLNMEINVISAFLLYNHPDLTELHNSEK